MRMQDTTCGHTFENGVAGVVPLIFPQLVYMCAQKHVVIHRQTDLISRVREWMGAVDNVCTEMGSQAGKHGKKNGRRGGGINKNTQQNQIHTMIGAHTMIASQDTPRWP